MTLKTHLPRIGLRPCCGTSAHVPLALSPQCSLRMAAHHSTLCRPVVASSKVRGVGISRRGSESAAAHACGDVSRVAGSSGSRSVGSVISATLASTCKCSSNRSSCREGSGGFTPSIEGTPQRRMPRSVVGRVAERASWRRGDRRGRAGAGAGGGLRRVDLRGRAGGASSGGAAGTAASGPPEESEEEEGESESVGSG